MNVMTPYDRRLTNEYILLPLESPLQTLQIKPLHDLFYAAIVEL